MLYCGADQFMSRLAADPRLTRTVTKSPKLPTIYLVLQAEATVVHNSALIAAGGLTSNLMAAAVAASSVSNKQYAADLSAIVSCFCDEYKANSVFVGQTSMGSANPGQSRGAILQKP